MQYFRYSGTYAGVPTESLNRYSNALVQNAELANKEYDLINQYISSIQTVDDSEKQYLNQFGEQINNEIAKIARDSQGNIKWHTATNAIRNLRRKVQSDEGLNNINQNYKLFVAEEDLARKIRANGQVPIKFNDQNWQGVSYNNDGTPQFNRYSGFYEVKGQSQEGYNELVSDLGIENQLKYRNLFNKKDSNTITAEEQKQLDDFLNDRLTISRARSETDQYYRELMQKYGNDTNKVEDHIKNNQLRNAIFTPTNAEITRNNELFKYRLEMAKIAAKNQADSSTETTASNSVPSPFTRGISRILPSNNPLNVFNIDDSQFDRKTGNLRDNYQRTLNQNQYDKLSEEQKKEYSPVVAPSGGYGAGTTNYVRDPKKELAENKSNIKKYRDNLKNINYPGIDDNTPDRIVYNTMKQLYDTEQNQMLIQFSITDPTIKKGLTDAGYIKNKEWFNTNLTNSSIKDINDPTDTKSFKDKFNVEEVLEVSDSGWGSFNKKLHNIEPGSVIYNVRYKNNKGDEKTATVTVPTSEKDINFQRSFDILGTIQEKLNSVDYSNTEISREGLNENNRNIIKPEQLGLSKDLKSLFFTPIKTINSNQQTSFKIKPVGKYNGINYYLDSFYVDSNKELQINPNQSSNPLINQLYQSYVIKY